MQVILQRTIRKSCHKDGAKYIDGLERKRATLIEGSSTDEEVVEEKKKKHGREGFFKR